MLFEARGDGADVFELVDKAFDQFSETMEIGTKDRDVDAPWHGLTFAQAPRLARF